MFFFIFAIAADIICRYQVLFSKVLLLLWGWQICWRGKKWPSVSSDSAPWLGIWGWIGPLFTSPSPNPLISTKKDFWKPPFEKIRDFRRFFSGVRDLLILKKKGEVHTQTVYYDLKSPSSVTRNAIRLLYTVPKQLGACLHRAFQKLASAPFKEVFSNRNSIFYSPFAIQRFLFTTYLAWGKLTWQLKVGAFKMYLLSKIKFSIAMLVYWRAKKTSHQNISPKSPGSQPSLLQGWLYITNQLFFRGKSLHNYHTHLHEVSSPQVGYDNPRLDSSIEKYM